MHIEVLWGGGCLFFSFVFFFSFKKGGYVEESTSAHFIRNRKRENLFEINIRLKKYKKRGW